MNEDGFQLGSENQRPVGELRVVERLDPDPVAHQEKRFRPLVPQREGEHPPEPFDEGRRAPFLVGVDDRLGIGPGRENMAAVPQLVPDFGEVVGLAVVGDPDRAVLIGEGLVAPLDVDDAQPAVAQPGPAVGVDPLVVGTAVDDGPAHPADQLPGKRRSFRRPDQPADAAHRHQGETSSGVKKTPSQRRSSLFLSSK